MAIISKIGSKSLKVRSLYLCMYAFLVVGSITMVYPFMLMIAGSTKSAVDVSYFNAIPQFLLSDTWLYRKHMEGLFNETILAYAPAYDSDLVTFEATLLPGEEAAAAEELEQEAEEERYKRLLVELHRQQQAHGIADGERYNETFVNVAEEFLENGTLPAYSYTIGYLETPISRTIPMNLRQFKNWLRERYGEDIDEVNKALGSEFVAWNWFYISAESYLQRREKPRNTVFQAHLDEFKAEQPLGQRYYFSADGYYKKEFLKPRYGEIEIYNQAHGTSYTAFQEIVLPRSLPANEKQATDWEEFVRFTLAMHWIRADESATPLYQEYLKARHLTIENLNKNYGTAFESFEDVPIIEEPPLEGMMLSDWEAFITGWEDPTAEEGADPYMIPAEALRVHSLETMFQDYLAARFGNDIEAINQGLGTQFETISDIRVPQQGIHLRYFLEHTGELRKDFVTRNYKTVAEFMLFHGRGIFNTVVYCALAILSALLVNPLAAYAMSRFKMPSSYKILLFMLCTMAFPPMVTSIPNFLMLRWFGLLNTFWALILPGLANGYAIFLLKGFFDAQPQELYESAQLDGANEWTLFWQIAMALSKPILAVIALQAFTAAYSNFMFAFVVCQDEKMWTLMVWLYQLQQRSGQPVMYASLIIAAIPTFLIFLFCQNIIMRGIVVPSEK